MGTSRSMSGGPSKAVTFLGSEPGSQTMPTTAMELLTQYGTNATVLEPTMLSYSNCILCYTCGEYYDYKVLALNTGTYYEYGSSCADPYHRAQNDNAYVCCSAGALTSRSLSWVRSQGHRRCRRRQWSCLRSTAQMRQSLSPRCCLTPTASCATPVGSTTTTKCSLSTRGLTTSMVRLAPTLITGCRTTTHTCAASTSE